jgi:hypothetical protein
VDSDDGQPAQTLHQISGPLALPVGRPAADVADRVLHLAERAGIDPRVLERRTGGEFWRLLGAAPARRPFTAGFERSALRSRRTRAGSPSESPQTRLASACRSRVPITPLPCGFHRKDERSDCETAGTALPLADSGGRSAAQRRSRSRGLMEETCPPNLHAGPVRPQKCAPRPKECQEHFSQIATSPSFDRHSPDLLRPQGGTTEYDRGKRAFRQLRSDVDAHIGRRRRAPRRIGDVDAASAGRSCRRR